MTEIKDCHSATVMRQKGMNGTFECNVGRFEQVYCFDMVLLLELVNCLLSLGGMNVKMLSP